MRLLTLAAGVAVGYVIGTRAGREKYDQIVDGARTLSQQPQVERAKAKVRELIGDTGQGLTPASDPVAPTATEPVTVPESTTVTGVEPVDTTPADTTPAAPKKKATTKPATSTSTI